MVHLPCSGEAAVKRDVWMEERMIQATYGQTMDNLWVRIQATLDLLYGTSPRQQCTRVRQQRRKGVEIKVEIERIKTWMEGIQNCNETQYWKAHKGREGRRTRSFIFRKAADKVRQNEALARLTQEEQKKFNTDDRELITKAQYGGEMSNQDIRSLAHQRLGVGSGGYPFPVTYDSDCPPEVRGWRTQEPIYPGRSLISEHIQGTGIDEGRPDEVRSTTSMSEAVYATAANVFDYVTNNLVAPFNVACSPKKSRRTDLGQELEVSQSISQSGLGVGSGTAHHYDVESTAASTKVKLAVRIGEVTEEDTEDCCQLIPGSKGIRAFGTVLMSPLLDRMVCYIISTFPETQQREGVIELYDSRAYREALLISIVDIIKVMIEESHFHLVIHLSHEEWRVHRPDQPRFILIMSSVIRQIIERVEQEFTEEVTFHIVIYLKNGEHRGIFEGSYSDMGEEDDPSDDNDPRSSIGKRSLGGVKEVKFPETGLGASPGRSNNQEDEGGTTRRSPSSNSTNESRGSQGIESNRCDLCDKINEGPLTVMRSPPEPIGYRMPRRLSLCEDCRYTEVLKNRRDLAEDEETRRPEQLLEKQRKEALATAAYETKMAELGAAKLKCQQAEAMKLGSGNTNIPRVTRNEKVRMGEEKEYAFDLEEAIRKEKIQLAREEAEIIDREEAEMTALEEEIRIRRKSRSPTDSTSTLKSGLRSPGGSEKSSNCSRASLPMNRRVSFHSGLTGEEEAAWELEGVHSSEISGSTRVNRLRADSADRLESRSSWSSKEPVRGGNSTSPSGRGLSVDWGAVSYDEDLEGKDEGKSPRKKALKGGKGRTEEPLARLLSKIPQDVDESTRAQLEMMAVQTATMQQKVAQNELTLEKTQLNDTLVLLKWVKDAVDGQVIASAGSHLAKIRDQSKGIPPDSTVVGQAFVEVWNVATEACTQMVWKENQYACAIHVFAKLMDHTIKWIQEPITSRSLTHQNWKTEPQRYFDGILRHWGLKSLDKLQRIELPDLIDLVRKSDRGTKRFKRATEETQTLIRDLVTSTQNKWMKRHIKILL